MSAQDEHDWDPANEGLSSASNSLGSSLDTLKTSIPLLVEQVKSLSQDPTIMGQLHEIEQMIILEVAKESRHLNCPGCAKWLQALITRMQSVSQSLAESNGLTIKP